jgi:hypothetical protein
VTKVPNILDHLECMMQDCDPGDLAVLTEARRIVTIYLLEGHESVGHIPPSWPLNLDEWEPLRAADPPSEPGWWAIPTGDRMLYVRRRK